MRPLDDVHLGTLAQGMGKGISSSSSEISGRVTVGTWFCGEFLFDCTAFTVFSVGFVVLSVSVGELLEILFSASDSWVSCPKRDQNQAASCQTNSSILSS